MTMTKMTFENCKKCSRHYKDANGNIWCHEWEPMGKIPEHIVYNENNVYCTIYKENNND